MKITPETQDKTPMDLICLACSLLARYSFRDGPLAFVDLLFLFVASAGFSAALFTRGRRTG